MWCVGENNTQRGGATWGMRIRGFVMSTLWIYTIFAGFFVVYAPLLPLLVINHTLFRLLADQLFSLWQLYPVALFQWVFKCQLHYSGDEIRSGETSLVIMNHRTRVDWNYAWIALYHATVPTRPVDTDHQLTTECRHSETISDHLDVPKKRVDTETKTKSLLTKMLEWFTSTARLKLVLKDEIKFVPAIGWIMQLNQFMFVKRRWSDDQITVDRTIHYYGELHEACGYKYQVLLFPEGTDLSPDTHRRSKDFAAAHQLQDYEYVLHPRTRGFAALCSRTREANLAAVYDVTIAYDVPPQSEFDLFCGRFPEHFHVHVTRHTASELPVGEDELACWLRRRWQDKELRLRHFHQHGKLYGYLDLERNPRSLARARVAFVVWSCVDAALLAAVFCSCAVRYWILYNVLLFAFVTYKYGGFDHLSLRYQRTHLRKK